MFTGRRGGLDCEGFADLGCHLLEKRPNHAVRKQPLNHSSLCVCVCVMGRREEGGDHAQTEAEERTLV